MNKDNLKTWPKTIYLLPRDTNKMVMETVPTYARTHLNSQWQDNPIRLSNFASIEYVRSDLAKEREAKLVKIAYGRGLDGHCDSEPTKNYQAIINSIYEEAGLDQTYTKLPKLGELK